MKRIALFISILFVTLGSTACSKDAEVNAFINEFDSATKELVDKINANPTSAGIDDARKTFESRKPQLKAKWDEIKTAVGAQVSSETKKRLETSIANNLRAITEVSMRNMAKLAADKEAPEKLKMLIEDYSGTFALPGRST
jgi:DNA-directed RNA polymerase